MPLPCPLPLLMYSPVGGTVIVADGRLIGVSVAANAGVSSALPGVRISDGVSGPTGVGVPVDSTSELDDGVLVGVVVGVQTAPDWQGAGISVGVSVGVDEGMILAADVAVAVRVVLGEAVAVVMGVRDPLTAVRVEIGPGLPPTTVAVAVLPGVAPRVVEVGVGVVAVRIVGVPEGTGGPGVSVPLTGITVALGAPGAPVPGVLVPGGGLTLGVPTLTPGVPTPGTEVSVAPCWGVPVAVAPIAPGRVAVAERLKPGDGVAITVGVPTPGVGAATGVSNGLRRVSTALSTCAGSIPAFTNACEVELVTWVTVAAILRTRSWKAAGNLLRALSKPWKVVSPATHTM